MKQVSAILIHTDPMLVHTIITISTDMVPLVHHTHRVSLFGQLTGHGGP